MVRFLTGGAKLALNVGHEAESLTISSGFCSVCNAEVFCDESDRDASVKASSRPVEVVKHLVEGRALKMPSCHVPSTKEVVEQIAERCLI